MFVQPCDNLVITLPQFQNTRLCQGGGDKAVKKHCGNLSVRVALVSNLFFVCL